MTNSPLSDPGGDTRRWLGRSGGEAPDDLGRGVETLYTLLQFALMALAWRAWDGTRAARLEVGFGCRTLLEATYRVHPGRGT